MTEEETPQPQPTEEQPSEAPVPTEETVAEQPTEKVEIPNIFMVGSFESARALVVLDEGKAYPMDDKADAFVREHNIPIYPDYPEGIHVEGSDRAADLVALTKKLEAKT